MSRYAKFNGVEPSSEIKGGKFKFCDKKRIENIDMKMGISIKLTHSL
jgi:hypothetical protein